MSSILSNVLKSALADRVVRQSTPTPQVPDNIARLIQAQPIPFIFIQSNNNCLSSNVSDGSMIIQSPVMNKGFRGRVMDLNINFTTVAGTVRIVKVRGQDGLILNDIVRGISASTSGTGAVILEEGEAIAVVGQSAGAGVFGVFFSGEITRTDV